MGVKLGLAIAGGKEAESLIFIGPCVIVIVENKRPT